MIPSIPTLCFAVAGAATSWLTRQLGLEKAILLSLVMLAAGLLLRGIPSTGHAAGGHRRRDVRAGDLQRGDAVLHPGALRAPHVPDDRPLHGDHDHGRHRRRRADRPRGAGTRLAVRGGRLRSASWPWSPASASCPIALHAHRNAPAGQGRPGVPLAPAADPHRRADHPRLHRPGAAGLRRAELVPLHAGHDGPHRLRERTDVRTHAARLRPGRHGAGRHRLTPPDAADRVLPGHRHHGRSASWPCWSCRSPGRR